MKTCGKLKKEWKIKHLEDENMAEDAHKFFNDWKSINTKNNLNFE